MDYTFIRRNETKAYGAFDSDDDAINQAKKINRFLKLDFMVMKVTKNDSTIWEREPSNESDS